MAHDSSFNEVDIDESLWESPVKVAKETKARDENPSMGPVGAKSTYIEQQAREEILRQELASVRKVNEVIENTIESLQNAKRNMKTVNKTVSAASSLLNTWTRILSQTEHNQRIILDPTWQGVGQDIADMQEEAFAKQQAIERREAEEQERKLAVARKTEEDERRKAEATTKPTRSSTRGRARPGSRGASISQQANTTGLSSTNTSSINVGRGSGSSSRATPGTSRGVGARGWRGRT